MYDHFNAISTVKVWGSEELEEIFENRNIYANPLFNNNRGVPSVDEVVSCKAKLQVGAFSLDVLVSSGHAADLVILIDAATNAAAGVTQGILYEVDVIFPGWVPFYNAALTTNYVAFLDRMDYLLTLDWEILVGGHLSRTGTKADVELQIRLYKDINDGAARALGSVDLNPIAFATGAFSPGNANAGNLWLVFNEYLGRVVESCYDYMMDAAARGIEYKTVLGGFEATLRSQCFVAQNSIRVSEGHPVINHACDAPATTEAPLDFEWFCKDGSDRSFSKEACTVPCTPGQVRRTRCCK